MKSRIQTFDMMRGAASLCVLYSHLGNWGAPFIEGGHLAVDFFFVLSGFVISRTYGDKIRNGMGFLDFISIRIDRLYPLFLLGLMIGLVRATAQLVHHHSSLVNPASIAETFALSIYILPSALMGNEIFPLNGPSWSLIFEIVANAFMFALYRNFRRSYLLLAAIAGAIFVVVASMHFGTTNIGWGWSNVWGSVPRVCFSFAVGVIISELKLFKYLPANAPGILITAAVCAAFIVPFYDQYRLLFEFACIFLLFPIAVTLGVQSKIPQVLQPVSSFLGRISYPMYCIHYPISSGVAFLAEKYGVPFWMWGPVLIVFLIVLSDLLARTYDVAARHWLSDLKAHWRGPTAPHFPEK